MEGSGRMESVEARKKHQKPSSQSLVAAWLKQGDLRARQRFFPVGKLWLHSRKGGENGSNEKEKRRKKVQKSTDEGYIILNSGHVIVKMINVSLSFCDGALQNASSFMELAFEFLKPCGQRHDSANFLFTLRFKISQLLHALV